MLYGPAHAPESGGWKWCRSPTFLCLCMVGACCAKALPAQEAPAAGLVQVSARQRFIGEDDTGSIHAVVRNVSPEPVAVARLTVAGWDVVPPDRTVRAKVKKEYFRLLKALDVPPRMPAESFPGEPLWGWRSSSLLEPGGCAEIIVRFRARQAPLPPLRIETGDGERLLIQVGNPFPLHLLGANFSESLDALFVYLAESEGATVPLISVAGLLGPSTGAATQYAELCLGQTRVLKLPLTGVKWGDRVFPRVLLSDGRCLAFSVLALSGFIVGESLASGNPVVSESTRLMDVGLLDTYTDYGYRYDVVAADVIDALGFWEESAQRVTRTVPSALFVQGIAAPAMTHYGELVPLSMVCCDALQVSYQPPYTEADMQFRQARARFFRQAVVPNRVLLEFRPYRGYGDVERFMTPAEVRLAAYQLLSRGSKGYRVRLPRAAARRDSLEWDRCSRELARVRREVEAVAPLLAIAEPVDGVGTTSEPLVEIATLLAGDKALIAMLINHDCSSPWPRPWERGEQPFHIARKPDPIRVEVRIPDGLAVASVVEVADGNTRTVPFSGGIGGEPVVLESDGLDAAKQYVLCFSAAVAKQVLHATSSPSPVAVDSLIDDSIFSITEALPPARADSVPQAGRHTPDIQVIPKHIRFGRLDPVRKFCEKPVRIRNVGKAELVVRGTDLPQRFQVSPSLLQVPAGQEGRLVVRMDVRGMPSSSQHVRLPLHTNDPNESQIFLDVGYRIQPEIVVGAASVVLDRGKTVRVSLLDNTGWNLEALKVESSEPGLRWVASRDDRMGVPNHFKVRNIAPKTRVVNLDLTLPPLPDGAVEMAKDKEETLTILTNNALYETIPLPMRVRPSLRASAMPPVVFAGMVKVGTRVERQCTILCEPGTRLVSATPSDGRANVKASPRDGGGFTIPVEIQAVARGRQDSRLTVKLQQGKLQRQLEIPITYIGVP